MTADSRVEAVGFFAALTMADTNLASRAAVVTTPDGWWFVDANPAIDIVVAADEETARGVELVSKW